MKACRSSVDAVHLPALSGAGGRDAANNTVIHNRLLQCLNKLVSMSVMKYAVLL
jgi:hypothetical protein